MRLVVFLVALLLIWLPLAAPIYLLGRDPNLVSILTIVLLYAEFILLLRFWSKHVYHQRHLLRQYGLERTQRNGLEVLTGLGIGITTVLSLFGIEAVLGWLIWQQPSVFLPQIILEGLIVTLAIGFAEELLFRGWLLDELQRDYRLGTALWVNAFIFALAHFIKPLAAIYRYGRNFQRCYY
jgi:membrane protease YdiL (CAAX protease family)